MRNRFALSLKRLHFFDLSPRFSGVSQASAPLLTNRRQGKAFTLVELLVVIAIISVLAAMLLPVLSKAVESARRAACTNNLHQIYLGAVSYSDDCNGEMPYHWSDPMDGSLATEECEYAQSIIPSTGWKTYHTAGYVASNLFTCPSQGWQPQLTTNRQGIHYSYRYNGRRVMSYSGDGQGFRYALKNVLGDPRRGILPLFADAARMRRDDSGNVVLTNTNNYYRRRWAHVEGGHLMRHDGKAFWFANRAPRWPGHWYGGGLWTSWDVYVRE